MLCSVLLVADSCARPLRHRVCVCVCVWQIAHMSRTEMAMLDTTFIGPGLLFLNQYFDTFFNELVVLWICFVSLCSCVSLAAVCEPYIHLTRSSYQL